MCLGRRFADLEIQMVIAKVGNNTIFRYRFKFIMPYVYKNFTEKAVHGSGGLTLVS
jgi:hypothetical protein